MKKVIFIILFIVCNRVKGQLQTTGPISIQQIANYMYVTGELTLAEKNGQLSVSNLNAKSRLVKKTQPFNLTDWYGYWTCGSNFKLTHTAGSVAPVTKTIIYSTVQTSLSGASKCWITQNLGADHSATTVNDVTEASGGWYWQFDRPQGFKIADDGITRTPNTAWVGSYSEASDWVIGKDPCALLLGIGWRIPTNSEWVTVGNNAAFGTVALSYSSVLQLHGAGWLDMTGALQTRGYNLSISTATSTSLTTSWEMSDQGSHYPISFEETKGYGYPLRCLKD